MDPLNPIPYEIEVRGTKEELYPLYLILVFGYFFILIGIMLMTRRGLIMRPDGFRH
jgi:hypothetical protein